MHVLLVPTDRACWQLSSTSLECTQTSRLHSRLLSQRSSFCEWTATAKSLMVFPVTFARGLDSRPAGRQSLRKRLVHWLPQPAGLRSGEERTQRTFPFFVNHLQEATLPACKSFCLLCVGRLDSVQQGSFIASAARAPAFSFFFFCSCE